MNKKLEEELNNPENYKDCFKDKCSVCGKSIPATWENYSVRGNYCSKCNEKCKPLKGGTKEIRKSFIHLLK